jgi:hypothetical protein
MAKIRNNHKSPIGLTVGVLIAPGKSATIADEEWARLRKHKVINAWLRAKLITEGADDAETVRVRGRQSVELEADGVDEGEADGDADGTQDDVNADGAPLSEDKDELIAELATYGDEMNRRSSVATLQEAVTNARAEAAAKE